MRVGVIPEGIIKKGCISPQLLLSGDGEVVPCGICLYCRKHATRAAFQRRLYWLNKRRFHNA